VIVNKKFHVLLKNSNDNMSNKPVVESYMSGFRAMDHAMVLECLTDDVVWVMPGFFRKSGKDEFDSEIENENFTGSPEITIIRMVEEGNIVVAEGEVKGKMKNGDQLNAVFCDVFHFNNGKIKQLTTCLMNR
jgi:ketosteroid isomerase-like protein